MNSPDKIEHEGNITHLITEITLNNFVRRSSANFTFNRRNYCFTEWQAWYSCSAAVAKSVVPIMRGKKKDDE